MSTVHRNPQAIARVRALAERRLSPEEFEAYVSAPISDEERSTIEELIAWFRRRYPRPLDRLRSARLAHARAQKIAPASTGDPDPLKP